MASKQSWQKADRTYRDAQRARAKANRERKALSQAKTEVEEFAKFLGADVVIELPEDMDKSPLAMLGFYQQRMRDLREQSLEYTEGDPFEALTDEETQARIDAATQRLVELDAEEHPAPIDGPH